MQLIVHNPIGCSKWISRSLTLHIESCSESLIVERVVVSSSKRGKWLVLPVVTVVMAADSGIVARLNRFSGDCIIELLMSIHKYSTESDKHTTLKWSSRIRFGELSWKSEKVLHKAWSRNQIAITSYSSYHSPSSSARHVKKALELHIHFSISENEEAVGRCYFYLATWLRTSLGWFANQISRHDAISGSVPVEFRRRARIALFKVDGECLRKRAENRFKLRPEASAREELPVVAS